MWISALVHRPAEAALVRRGRLVTCPGMRYLFEPKSRHDSRTRAHAFRIVAGVAALILCVAAQFTPAGASVPPEPHVAAISPADNPGEGGGGSACDTITRHTRLTTWHRARLAVHCAKTNSPYPPPSGNRPASGGPVCHYKDQGWVKVCWYKTSHTRGHWVLTQTGHWDLNGPYCCGQSSSAIPGRSLWEWTKKHIIGNTYVKACTAVGIGGAASAAVTKNGVVIVAGAVGGCIGGVLDRWWNS